MNNFVFLGFTLLWSYAQSSCVTPLGKKSQCIPLHDCPELLNAFQQKPIPHNIIEFLRESQCGFEGQIPRVCCGPLTKIPNDSTNGLMVTPTTSKTVDPVNPEDSFPTPRDRCGIDMNGDRIFGGQITDLDEHAWMVLLGYMSHKTQKMTYQCGGALINHRYVLSAAHCVTGQIEIDVGKLKTARLGEYDLQTNPDCLKSRCADPIQEVAVHSVYPHSGYSDKNINRKDDISLVRLAQRARYSDYVQPICLTSSSLSLQPGFEVFVAGWGKTLSGSSSPVKLKLSLKIFNKNDCVSKYRSLRAILTDRQICAGGVLNEDTCRGDSGGPLMRNIGGTWEVVAIVSFGYDCGRDGWPGVYTSVASYMDWIENVVRTTNV